MRVITKEAITYSATIELSEREIRGLAKVLEWGETAAVEGLFLAPSEREVAPYRNDLLALFKNLRGELAGIVQKAEKAKKVFDALET